jgi:hypothetical protein
MKPLCTINTCQLKRKGEKNPYWEVSAYKGYWLFYLYPILLLAGVHRGDPCSSGRKRVLFCFIFL